MFLPRYIPASAVASLIVLSSPVSADVPSPEAVAQEMLDALVEVSGVPGLGAAIWQNGQIAWTGSSGQRDIQHGLPVDRNTRFRLASVSKLLAVTAAAKLAEDGRLDLDAPVGTILPWLDNDWPPISLRQLASHSSGIPHYQSIDAGLGQKRYDTQQDAVGIFSGRPLLFAPGADYRYSSWGYTLLGAVIEQESGEDFADYVAQEVTPGLMIGRDATDSGEDNVSIAYDFRDGVPVRAEPRDYSYTWGGGGMMGTAESVAAFGGLMLENRIVNEQVFDKMVRPYVLSSGENAGEDGYTVGFGWRASNDSTGNPVVFHNGVTLGARSSLVLWREEGIASTILSNVSWVSSIDSTAHMLAAPFRSAPDGLVTARCPVNVTRYEGTFGQTAVVGTARFALEKGQCRGELAIGGELQNYFTRPHQPVPDKMIVISLDGKSGLSRAGLVTPYGIYELRAETSTAFTSAFSSTRSLKLTFH